MKFFSRFFNKKYMTVTDETGKLNIFGLAIPLFLENIGVHLVGVVQTMMSSHYAGGFFVIPTSVVTSVMTIYLAIIGMSYGGMSIILSICIGRNKSEDCKSIIGTTLISGVIFAVLVGILMLVFIEPLLAFMGANSPEYLPYKEYAITYYYYRVPAIIISVITSTLSTALRCYGHTKVGLYCSLTANVVNAVVTALAMFVFCAPQEYMGHGLGAISLFSAILNALLVFIYFKHRKIKTNMRFSWRWCKNIYKIGFPSMMSSIFYTLGQTITASLTLSLAPSAFLAKNYVGQLVYFVYIFGYSLGQANAIITGRVCGKGDFEFADNMNKQNTRITVAIDVALSCLLVLVGPTLLRLMYNADESVIAYAQIALLIDIIVEAGRGLSHVSQYALNSAGDVRFTTAIMMTTCGIFTICCGYLFTALGFGLAGIWVSFALDEMVRGIVFFIRWKKGGWKKRFASSLESMEKG